MTTVIENSAEDVGLRERKKLATRAAIHAAAYRLIESQGLEATTIEQICQEADVSSRTFFNYYSSKAAAALELHGSELDPAVIERFRAAEGTLVDALCLAIGASAERVPTHAQMKQLLVRRPELLPTMSQMMLEVRGSYVDLAAERATSTEQAGLAVTLVMAALGMVIHEEGDVDAPLGERLRERVRQIVDVAAQSLAAATAS